MFSFLDANARQYAPIDRSICAGISPLLSMLRPVRGGAGCPGSSACSCCVLLGDAHCIHICVSSLSLLVTYRCSPAAKQPCRTLPAINAYTSSRCAQLFLAKLRMLPVIVCGNLCLYAHCWHAAGVLLQSDIMDDFAGNHGSQLASATLHAGDSCMCVQDGPSASTSASNRVVKGSQSLCCT